MVPFSFAGHDFRRQPDGALYWPRAERAAGRRPASRKGQLVRADRASSFRPTIRSPRCRRSNARSTLRRDQPLLPGRQLPRPLRLRPPARRRPRSAHQPDRPARLGLDHRQPRRRLRRSLRRADRRGNRGRRNHRFATKPIPSDPRPEMSGHFHPKLRINLQGPPASRAAASSRPDQADPAGVRVAHRRSRRASSRDLAESRPRRGGIGPGHRPTAALPDRGLGVGQFRPDHSAHHIADGETLGEIGERQVGFDRLSFLDQLARGAVPASAREPAAG